MTRLALLLSLVCAPALFAQEDPTPFWMPPAPAPAQKPLQKKKKKPGQVEPMEMKRIEPAQRSRPEPQRVEPEAPLSTRRPVAPLPPVPAMPTQIPRDEQAGQPPPPFVVEPPAARRPERTDPEGQSGLETTHSPSPRFSAAAVFGLWGKSSSTGAANAYDVAYGQRIGFDVLRDLLEVEFEAVRAGATRGNPFASASATHTLLALRAFYLLGAGRLTLLAGGGAGVVVAQTHYSLRDVGTPASSLDATSARLVLQVTAAGRARIYRGLEVRAEVSGLLRDGKLELLPLLGLGAAF